jgi:hypothetical protein
MSLNAAVLSTKLDTKSIKFLLPGQLLMSLKLKAFWRRDRRPLLFLTRPFPMSTPKRKRAIGHYDDSESDSGFEPAPAKRVPAPIPAYTPVKVGGQNKG